MYGIVCSGQIAETTAMLTLMQERPALAQKLMLASIKSNKKRKADEIAEPSTSSDTSSEDDDP